MYKLWQWHRQLTSRRKKEARRWVAGLGYLGCEIRLASTLIPIMILQSNLDISQPTMLR